MKLDGTPITTLNWGYAPFNRRSFQHVQQLFPSCRLVRGDATPCGFAVQDSEILSLTYESPGQGKCSVRQLLDDSYTDAFIVAKSGAILAEEYFNDMTVDSHHLLNSVTKSFVGMLAGVAVAEGRLEPGALVSHYLPELEGSAWNGATVRHLLDMTAGVDYQEDYADPQTDFWQEAAVVGWRPALVDENTPSTLNDYARSLSGQDQANGARFHYRTVTTNVIGMILERVMNAPLGTLLGERIWARLGTRHEASIVVDPSGFPYVGAGMSACARDLVNFGMMMIDGSRFDGREIIPADWIEDTLNGDDSSRQCFADGDYGEVMDGWHYRNQVWVADSRRGVMLAIGIHGQVVYMDKTSDVVVVKLSSQPESVDLEVYLDTFAAMSALAGALR